MGIRQGLPASQMAIIAGSNGQFEVAHEHPITPLSGNEILIKTAAVALNPVDTKLIGPFITPNAVFGFDCAGSVVAIGDKVDPKLGLSVGDRVCGSARGMNKSKPLGGAFAEYVSLPAALTLKLPEEMRFEEAASLGTAIASACVALFWTLSVPASLSEPASKPFSVLVYGGSTATGTMILQMLKLCGARTLTTCSPKNFDLVKSYGADEVYDYRSSTCAEDIRTATKNSLKFTVDCIATDASTRLCYKAIGRAGGKYAALNPYVESAATRKVVTPDWILATDIIGEGSEWPEPFSREPNTEMRGLAENEFAVLQGLLNIGKIRPHPVEVSKGGLPAVLDGVQMLRKNQVSGKKLVYVVEIGDR